MEGQDQNQPPTPPAQAPQIEPRPPAQRRKWWALLEAIWDSVCDSSLSPLNSYLKNELPHLRSVIDLLILFMFVGGFAGWCLRGCAANSKYAFVAGQLAAKTDTIKLLEKQMETRRQDDNDVITQLKIDASELKRERDTTQQRLDYFQSLPDKVLNLYTNIQSL
jgi:hypothetical protein